MKRSIQQTGNLWKWLYFGTVAGEKKPGGFSHSQQSNLWAIPPPFDSAISPVRLAWQRCRQDRPALQGRSTP